jgi:hypothetical protein
MQSLASSPINQVLGVRAELMANLDRYAGFNGNFVLVALKASCGFESDSTEKLVEVVDDFLI